MRSSSRNGKDSANPEAFAPQASVAEARSLLAPRREGLGSLGEEFSSMVRHSDREVLLRMGQALWNDASAASEACLEALSVASLGHKSSEVLAEEVASSLLRKAHSRALSTRTLLISPFFRLPPQARLVLAALHGSSRWSWSRLARVFAGAAEGGGSSTSSGSQKERELVALISQLAWSARLELGWDLGKGDSLLGQELSRGQSPLPHRMRCPELDPRTPWTQRFLDEECSAQERLYLQNHLMACDSCRHTIAGARKLFAQVDLELNRCLMAEPMDATIRAQQFDRSIQEMTYLKRIFFRRSAISLADSLRYHWGNARNRWVLFAGIGLMVLGFFLQSRYGS